MLKTTHFRRTSLRFVLERCYVGDWFVLVQLCRNVNVYFYREFIKQLKIEMQGHPKSAMRDRSMSVQGYKERHPGLNLPETRVDIDPTPSEPEEKPKSQYLLRIEHEQRLMPGMRGRNRGRGRGRGARGGRGKKLRKK